MLAKLSIQFDRTIGRRFYRVHRFVYRWTGGLIGHRSPAGPILLLTTVGRKTGQRRTTPLLYMPDGPRFVVVGSNSGPRPAAGMGPEPGRDTDGGNTVGAPDAAG